MTMPKHTLELIDLIEDISNLEEAMTDDGEVI